MSDPPKPEPMSRRGVLSLLGLAGALGLAVPRNLLTIAHAAAQTIPPAFDQVDKPIPGESTARTPPQPDKPIVGDDTGLRRRRLRRKRVQERRAVRTRRRSKPAEPQQLVPAGADKPKWVP